MTKTGDTKEVVNSKHYGRALTFIDVNLQWQSAIGDGIERKKLEQRYIVYCVDINDDGEFLNLVDVLCRQK